MQSSVSPGVWLGPRFFSHIFLWAVGGAVRRLADAPTPPSPHPHCVFFCLNQKLLSALAEAVVNGMCESLSPDVASTLEVILLCVWLRRSSQAHFSVCRALTQRWIPHSKSSLCHRGLELGSALASPSSCLTSLSVSYNPTVFLDSCVLFAQQSNKIAKSSLKLETDPVCYQAASRTRRLM